MRYLQLVRWKNLVIISITQFSIWLFLIKPIYSETHMPLHTSIATLIGILLSTLFIAAAGYIINDYFDIKTDAINRPNKLLLENTIDRRKAILLHLLLTLVGVLIGVIIALQHDNILLVGFQIISSLLLWFYSTRYKQSYLTGNILVAALTSICILMFYWYEPQLAIHKNAQTVLFTTALFAFTLTWMRELIKDMEDLKGDTIAGCKTMPIVIGLQKSGRIVQVIGILSVLLLALLSILLFNSAHYFFSIYLSLSTCLPLIMVIAQVNKDATSEHYAQLSSSLKFIMLLGLSNLFIYYINY